MTDHVRAPRLTKNRLDDLDAVVEVALDNIRYLDDAIECSLNNTTLKQKFTEKRDRLRRGHDYLVGMLAAERSRRD